MFRKRQVNKTKCYYVVYYYGTDSDYNKYGAWVIAKDEKDLTSKLNIKHGHSKSSERSIIVSMIYITLPLEVFIEETNGLITDERMLDKLFNKYAV